MAATGLFLEGTLRKDFTGILSIIALTYILAPFQAYAALKGLLEKKEGPWFRTFKTGAITEPLTLMALKIRRRLLTLFPRRWMTHLTRAGVRVRRVVFGPPKRLEIELADETTILRAVYELDYSFFENKMTTKEYLSERQKFVADLTAAKRHRERRLGAEKSA
jgi:hypothetical protein